MAKHQTAIGFWYVLMIWLLFFNSGCGIGFGQKHLMEVSLVFFFSTSLVRRWGKQTWQEMEHDLVNWIDFWSPFFFIARYINWLLKNVFWTPMTNAALIVPYWSRRHGSVAGVSECGRLAVDEAAGRFGCLKNGRLTPRMAVSIGKMNMRVGAIKNFGSLFCPIFRQSYLGMLHGNSGLRLENPMGSTSLMFEHLDYGFPFTREIASQSAMDISASHLIAKHLQAHLSV